MDSAKGGLDKWVIIRGQDDSQSGRLFALYKCLPQEIWLIIQLFCDLKNFIFGFFFDAGAVVQDLIDSTPRHICKFSDLFDGYAHVFPAMPPVYKSE